MRRLGALVLLIPLTACTGTTSVVTPSPTPSVRTITVVTPTPTPSATPTPRTGASLTASCDAAAPAVVALPKSPTSDDWRTFASTALKVSLAGDQESFELFSVVYEATLGTPRDPDALLDAVAAKCGPGAFADAVAGMKPPKLTVSQEQAVRKAEQYLDFTPFSAKGLVDQLVYEGFSREDSTFAVEFVEADWFEQAALKAQAYLDMTSFSRSGLIKQLEYEGFTRAQAEHGVAAVGL